MLSFNKNYLIYSYTTLFFIMMETENNRTQNPQIRSIMRNKRTRVESKKNDQTLESPAYSYMTKFRLN